ncbi:hypothetical protein Trydic_g18279 [Trypoxylus dichotomus]
MDNEVMMNIKKEEAVVVKLEDSHILSTCVKCDRTFEESGRCNDPISEIGVDTTEIKIELDCNIKAESIFEEEFEIVNEHEIDKQPLDSILEFDENDVPKTENCQKLTWKKHTDRAFEGSGRCYNPISKIEIDATEIKIELDCNITAEDMFEEEFGIVNEHEIDSILEFDENDVPKVKNGQELTRRKHTEEPPYKHTASNKLFALKSRQEIHSNEYEYTCDICKKRFKNKNILLLHKRMHTKLKPFRCDVCTATLKESTGFKVHMESSSNEKLHICDTCHKCFLNNIHKPFACNLCDKRFTMKSLLKDHSVFHTNEIPYV